MQITAVLNVHGDIPLVKDTIESVKAWMTNQILLVVDDHAWHEFESEKWPCSILRGFYHNYHRAPYRNVVYGLHAAAEHWPESEWYCYLEYDALVASPAFQPDIIQAGKDGYWLLGCDLRQREERFPMVEHIIGQDFKQIFSVLGAVLFYHRDFLQKGIDTGFWEKFLYYTNDFRDGFFPEFKGWDLAEHMMPTLANHWGGKVGQLSCWTQWNEWTGNSDKYPIRWKPEIMAEEARFASIIHPLKTFDHPIRVKHRQRRKRANKYCFPSETGVDN
jgi:hypothetical protein